MRSTEDHELELDPRQMTTSDLIVSMIAYYADESDLSYKEIASVHTEIDRRIPND